jgi:hypothetical protein
VGLVLSISALADTPSLPFTEDFSDVNLQDPALTNANWSTEEQALALAWRQRQFGAMDAGLTGSDLTSDPNSTRSLAIGDVDSDGDLDLVAGNWNQTNRLYLNNGTADPWNGVSGSDITADSHDTTSVALGDVDGDGDLDLVAVNYGQVNRLYQRRLYHTARGQAVSLRVDDEIADIASAKLTATETTPPNTEITYWMSNNGGTRWFIVKSGERFTFPTTGHDLRWKAELRSLSPVITPWLDQVYIDGPQVELTTSSNPGGAVTNPGEGAYLYDKGSIVTIVAQCFVGYEFASWTGSGVGSIADPSSASTTITMDDNHAVHANCIHEGTIFADGFESGDTMMWSAKHP